MPKYFFKKIKNLIKICTHILDFYYRLRLLDLVNQPTIQCYKDETDSKYTVKNSWEKNSEPPVGIEPTTFQLLVECSIP